MMNRELVIHKGAIIETYLKDLEGIIGSVSDEILLKNKQQLYAIERLLQLFVDTTVDINTYVITSNKFAPPDNNKGTFIILGEQKVIPHDLAMRISESVGLRNAVVHRYEEVSHAFMLTKIRQFIPLYRDFLRKIIEYLTVR